MAKGLPKSIIKKYGITKKAWEVFRGTKTGTKTKGLRTSRVEKYVGKHMAKGKSTGKKKSWRRKITLPLSLLAPFGASFLTPPEGGWNSPLNAVFEGDYNAAGASMLRGWTGVHPDGHTAWTFPAYAKWMIIGGLIHLLAGKIGINRALGRSGVPYVRV